MVCKQSCKQEVPQNRPKGSVLGHLLFVIYINDLDLGLSSKVSKFADDTKLEINASNPESVRPLQRDLAAIGE